MISDFSVLKKLSATARSIWHYPTTYYAVWCVASTAKIAWVVTNLPSNAIHHCEQNSRVLIGVRQIEKQVEIFVQDFGRGIDERYHKTIFDRYFRVPGTKVQGSGLGLAISKDFVEAHRGTIRVESDGVSGSCFIVSLGLA